jgi:hypothetical protein
LLTGSCRYLTTIVRSTRTPSWPEPRQGRAPPGGPDRA